MRKFTMFIMGLMLPLMLSAQTLPKGMTDITAGIAANDAGFKLTTQDDRSSPKSSAFTINKSGTLMFFTATSTAAGEELWVTDGTASGTKMVKDINPGAANSSPKYLTLIGDTVYFIADDGTHGVELWMSDGTSAGTKLVSDINSVGSNSSNPMLLTNFNGKLLFWAQNVAAAAASSWYMFVYDPQNAGSFDPNTPVSQVLAENSGDNNYSFVVVLAKKGLAFFSSDKATAGTGEEVYVTDGTQAGTKLLMDVWPGAGGSGLQWLVPFGDSAVVWRENTPIKYAGADSTSYSGGTTGLDQQIWVSDGTTAGTHLLSFFDKAVNSTGGGTGTQFAWPKYFPEVNGMLFRADDGTHGVELSYTNGKDSAGTYQIADINAGSGSSWPEDFAVFHGYVCFDAQSNVTGAQPMYWDPVSKTVKLMSDVYPGGNAWTKHLTTVTIAGKDSFLYFTGANATSGDELFVCYGVGSDANLIVDMGPGDSKPNNLRSWKDALFLTYSAFPRLYKVAFEPHGAIMPLTAPSFSDANWNDTIAVKITRTNPELFLTKKIKIEIPDSASTCPFRISNTKTGGYGFSCKTLGNDTDVMYIVAGGKYLNPDSFVRNIELRLSTPNIDTLNIFASSIVSPSFRYEKLYHVVCGNDSNYLKGVSLGEYQKHFDQQYGLDDAANKSWGYATSDWSMTGNGTQWDGEREIHDKAFGPGKGMIYKFEVDNGDYMVWVGFHEFWSPRAEKLKITGIDTINLTTTTGYVWYKNKVTASAGVIEVDVQCAKDNGYMNNIIIGKFGAGTGCFDPLCTLRDSLYGTVTSITKVSNEQGISSYPNPSSGIVTLKANAANYKSYNVIDITGKTILSGKIVDNNTTINLSNRSEGIYLIRIYGNNGNVSLQKILIQR